MDVRPACVTDAVAPGGRAEERMGLMGRPAGVVAAVLGATAGPGSPCSAGEVLRRCSRSLTAPAAEEKKVQLFKTRTPLSSVAILPAD